MDVAAGERLKSGRGFRGPQWHRRRRRRWSCWLLLLFCGHPTWSVVCFKGGEDEEQRRVVERL